MPTARRGLPSRLARFVLERFPLQSYGLLIVALVAGGSTAAALATGASLQVTWATPAIALAVACAFLQLRVLDEIRDEAADRLGRPERPLPRGLVTAFELRAFAALAAATGVAIVAMLGGAGLAWYGLALGVIWLLGLDLPHRLSIGLGILRNAALHSVIAPILTLYIWAATARVEVGVALAAAVVLVWSAGLALEIGRKTVQPQEERPGVETYSAEIGRTRALLLTGALLSTSCCSATVLAVSVGGAAVTAVIPLAAAVVIAVAAATMGPPAGTKAIQSVASSVVLITLLWPLVIAGAGP